MRSAQIHHRVPTVGYVLEEYARPGKLDGARARALGVPSGPLMGELKASRDVTLPDGRVVRYADVISAPQPGKKVSFLQDTHDASPALSEVLGSSLMIHECTYDAAVNEEVAVERGHSTTVMAAKMALAAGAETLILTHFSSRYIRETLEKRDDGQIYFQDLAPSATSLNTVVNLINNAPSSSASATASASEGKAMCDDNGNTCAHSKKNSAATTATAAASGQDCHSHGHGHMSVSCSTPAAVMSPLAAVSPTVSAPGSGGGIAGASRLLNVTDLKLEAEAVVAAAGGKTVVETAADFRSFEVVGHRWVPSKVADVSPDLLM